MEQFDNIMNVNVKYLFEMSVVCYPYLKKSADKGRIINITSMSAHLGFSEVVPYCTSKGAVLAMTRALAVEWAGDNITVNSIAPGWFRSKMNEQVVDAAREQKILNRMPCMLTAIPAIWQDGRVPGGRWSLLHHRSGFCRGWRCPGVWILTELDLWCAVTRTNAVKSLSDEVVFSLSESKCTVSARFLHGFKTCRRCKSLQNRTKGAETRSSKPAMYRR